MSAIDPQVPPCRACSSPPQGIVGHPHLRVQFLGSAHMLFRCEQCHCLWSRSGPKEGPFKWAASSFTNTRKYSPGIALPRRSDPSTSFG
ncbi:MAG TPA: hypothetical protein VM073_07770 [Usitatibacter sp.]|nr:hypothetical protein [Usitatibacter sp.]